MATTLITDEFDNERDLDAMYDSYRNAYKDAIDRTFYAMVAGLSLTDRN